MERRYRVTTIRTPEEQSAAFEAVASFINESFNSAVIKGMGALVREIFKREIEIGKDLLLRRCPEIYLSDVCKAFEIDFPKAMGPKTK